MQISSGCMGNPFSEKDYRLEGTVVSDLKVAAMFTLPSGIVAVTKRSDTKAHDLFLKNQSAGPEGHCLSQCPPCTMALTGWLPLSTLFIT